MVGKIITFTYSILSNVKLSSIHSLRTTELRHRPTMHSRDFLELEPDSSFPHIGNCTGRT
jgi:hypothetical protein